MAADPRTSGFYKQIGRRIAQKRDAADLSQLALAERVGLSRSTIANIESGRQQLLVHVLVDVARAVGVAVADLVPTDDGPGMSVEVRSLSPSIRSFVERVMIKGSTRGARKPSSMGRRR